MLPADSCNAHGAKDFSYVGAHDSGLGRLDCLPAYREVDPGIRICIMQILAKQRPTDYSHILLFRPHRVNINPIDFSIRQLTQYDYLRIRLLIVDITSSFRRGSSDW